MIPYTNHEKLMLLEELERGDKIVLPTSIEHAEAMLRVANFYIDQQHQETMRVLKENR